LPSGSSVAVWDWRGVTMLPAAVQDQDAEGLPVTALGLLDDVAIQPIVLPGVRRGRLPTLLSRGGPRAFTLQIRVGTDTVRSSDDAIRERSGMYLDARRARR
jgi:hypothetical protein